MRLVPHVREDKGGHVATIPGSWSASKLVVLPLLLLAYIFLPSVRTELTTAFSSLCMVLSWAAVHRLPFTRAGRYIAYTITSVTPWLLATILYHCH